YSDSIVVIDTTPINTTDFGISEAEKTFLLLRGRASALRHLFQIKGKRAKNDSDFPVEAEVLRAEAAAAEAIVAAGRARRSRRLKWLTTLAFACFAVVALGIRYRAYLPSLREGQASVRTTFASFRSPVVYHVSLHDAPSPGSRFLVADSAAKYLFYKA